MIQARLMKVCRAGGVCAILKKKSLFKECNLVTHVQQDKQLNTYLYF